ELGDHHAQGSAMLAADRLAVPAPRQQHVIGREISQRDVGGVGVVGMEDDVLGRGLGLHELQEIAWANALPLVVIARPGSDAVDVSRERALGQVGELAPFPRRRAFDLAVDEQAPGMSGDSRLDAEIEHRPVLDLALAGRQALRMGSGLAGQQPAALGPLLLAVYELVLELAEQGDVVFGHGFLQMLRPAFSQYGLRSLRLKILPESSRGRAALNSTTFGTL